MTSGSHYCIICGLHKQEGLLVREHFICHDCEKTLIATTPQDEAYYRLVQMVKKLWEDECQPDGVKMPADRSD